ncbi:type II toxin-antitoxin system HipA family toxin [Telmatospirillum sp.]|uniref:type II toxin-antitoxin system HipA family toxin n=1 Tax=Telmatospirillum sp. TaxID=2079197 RepID=UPI00284A1161|nr:type II toxin-antitoxin system HipA family toxin [Telmatospirillum sp.]MDR3440327.1 type II toxin-antitoxin system HipA family toxin [Telmatospirillum sp.]
MASSVSPAPDALFVWIWLPGATKPVVAGRLAKRADGRFAFNYGQSYLRRGNAIPIYLPELPLVRGVIEPMEGLSMPGCLRDGSPDSWGRRVIINRVTGATGDAAREVELDELAYLINSGSDRIGALDFQISAADFVPRQMKSAPMEELLDAAAKVEAGVPLTPALDDAINHGTSIGGARPKAPIEDGDRRYIAKFSASNDTYSVVKGEFVAMSLARLAGLSVAPVRMVRSTGKDVLLVERFDRVSTNEGMVRKNIVSALTIFGLDEMLVRYASYEELVNIVRERFTSPKETTRELFGRLAMNILVGNTDDHPRNHAAFWDGKQMTLTPAYDVCPQPRSGGEATQGMKIHGEDRRSQIATLLDAAAAFGISRRNEACQIVEAMIWTVRDHWTELCDEARVTEVDRRLFAGRQFLNPYAFERLAGAEATMARLADDVRREMAP